MLGDMKPAARGPLPPRLVCGHIVYGAAVSLLSGSLLGGGGGPLSLSGDT